MKNLNSGKMNRGWLLYALLLVAVLPGFLSLELKAQSPFEPGQSEKAKVIREEVQLFTDRNMYAVNEAIHFVAEHRMEGVPEGSFWSSVLYVELISAEGKAVEQGKFPLLAGRARGSLKVPLAAISGDYYLKSYTRWMRNQGSASFAFVPMKIINPFRSEVLSHASGEMGTDSLSRLSYREGGLLCTTSSEVYRAGENAEIIVEGPLPEYLNQINCCLTVVPEGAIDLSGGQYLPSSSGNEEAYKVSFLPDLGSGVAVSGTVIDANQDPVNSATLHFSLLGDNPDYFAAISDEFGRFIFTAPAGLGPQELFVTPQRVNGNPPQVRIDQEFDNQPVSLPKEKFHLTEDQQALARRISLNMQLSRAFNTGTAGQELLQSVSVSETARGKDIPFYGSRVKQLKIDDYVRLPNLEEVFINLVPDVQFYKKKGETQIRILSENASIGVFEPLVMVDHISVFNHEAVLALTPDKIERIDLINEVYLKGNVAFGGVLAIYSKKGDMAGIDLPEGSYFFDYHSFYPATLTEGPDIGGTEHAQSDRIPDTRNTFCWKSDLQLFKDKQLKIPFVAPETPGDYVVVVRGLDPRGEVLSSIARFRVEKDQK